MIFRFALHQARAESVSDEPLDPFNKESEFYQTWQLMALEQMGGGEAKVEWAKQGFSFTGSPDDGVSFRNGESRVLEDPVIAFNLPVESIAEGSTKAYSLRLHWWESDNSSQEVRAAFSDATLAMVLKVWKDTKGNEAAAVDAVRKWIDGKGEALVKAAMAAAALSAGSWVSVGFAALPLIELIVDAVKSNSDDYIAVSNFLLEFTKTGGRIEWRVTPPNAVAVPTWTPAEKVVRVTAHVEDGTRRNSVDADYVCMLY